MDKPLRILAIVNLPWDPRLGAARVWIELAEQWTAAGHTVEKFCLTDAFPYPTKSRGLAGLRQLLFPYRARQFVRQNAFRFDVIDALIGTFPFSKESVRFQGLLVARSVGLYRLYHRFVQASQAKWRDQPRGKLLGSFFYNFVDQQLRRNSDRAIRYCDLVNLPNEDEIEPLRSPPNFHRPTMVQPYGLNEESRLVFAGAVEQPAERLQQKQICFVGAWSVRKGSRDWPEIIRRLLSASPDVHLMFLGTMADEQTVLQDLQLSNPGNVRSVSTYEPAELPGLLRSCVLGLFPSYIEGFPFALLEQLAAGIPVVAYDVGGPRHILRELGGKWLVNEGDTKAMAERALEVLGMNAAEYAALSDRCRFVAGQFHWESVASETLRQYSAALSHLRHGQPLAEIAVI